LTQQKKPRKVGRPKLPKGEAKGRIVPVRFTANDLRAIELSANLYKDNISGWLRRVLPREVRHKNYIIRLTTRAVELNGFETFGWIINQTAGTKPIAVVPPGSHPTKQSAFYAGVNWCKQLIDRGSTNDATIYS